MERFLFVEETVSCGECGAFVAVEYAPNAKTGSNTILLTWPACSKQSPAALAHAVALYAARLAGTPPSLNRR